jgi:hypothetical protein
MQAFCSKGDVQGIAIAIVASDKNQLVITTDGIVPGSVEWMLHFLADEPGQDQFGPFEATDTNIRSTKARSMV